jgi:hypothetical protein
MLPIVPDGIAFLEGNDTLIVGMPHNVSAQLLYKGGPLKSEGVRVYVLSNNTSIVGADIGTYVFTDKDGIATYTAIANKTGVVRLRALAMSANSGVSADKAFIAEAPAVATPSPTPVAASATPTPAPSPTPTQTATIAPTITAKPQQGGSDAQAIGIIVTGVVIAIILLIMALILRPFIKK